MKQLICLLILAQLSSIVLSQKQLVHLQNSQEEYNNLGLIKDTIKPWEDGSRISTAKGNYETWYYRANLEDSSCVTVFFLMRDIKKLNKVISPYIIVEIVLANGKKIERNIRCKASDFQSSSTTCDVRIGGNYFVGDLKKYRIHINDSILKMDIAFESTVAPWRPKTGHVSFGNKGKYWGWIVPVPKGNTEVTYTFKGNTTSTKGTCFHDHNWSNVSPQKPYNNFYWLFGSSGSYRFVITSIITEKKYNYEPQFFFAAFKDGKMLIDDANKVTTLKSIGIKQPIGNREVSDVFLYNYKDGGTEYDLTLKKQEVITSSSVIHNKLVRKLAKLLAGFDGSWYRIQYEATMKVYKNGCLIESATSNEPIWMELFYFGKAH